MMTSFVSFIALVALACVGLARAGTVVHFQSQGEFDKLVNGGTNVLVEFYAPWCGHCKSLAPEWDSAAKSFEPSDDVVLAAVDATKAQALAKKYGVKGYPTLKFFTKGNAATPPEEYTGGRTADTIVEWLNTRVGTAKRVKQPPTAVTVLTKDNFDAVVGSKATLVEFYAPWCGHCKTLIPVYEKLAAAFIGDAKSVAIAKVDATAETELASKYNVQGFPTIRFFPAGATSETESSLYEGPRELQAMVQYVNEKAGLHRTMFGTLLPVAGRVTALDDIITAAKVVDKKLLARLETAVEGLTGRDAEHGRTYYLALGKRIVEKGVDYIGKEIARLTDLIDSPSVQPESRTGFQMKQNVLKAFVKAPPVPPR